MTDAWEERKKALENQYFFKLEKELIDRIKTDAQEEIIRKYCLNRCPKCGDKIEPMTFREVPLDRCPGCGGVWMGPKDLSILAEKDHRTWFDKWFKAEHNPGT